MVDSLQELEASVDCVHREIAIFRRLQASFGSGFGSADQEVYIQSGVCSIKIIERTGVSKWVVQIAATGIQTIRQTHQQGDYLLQRLNRLSCLAHSHGSPVNFSNFNFQDEGSLHLTGA